MLNSDLAQPVGGRPDRLRRRGRERAAAQTPADDAHQRLLPGGDRRPRAFFPPREFRLTEALGIALAILARARRTLALCLILRRRANPSVGEAGAERPVRLRGSPCAPTAGYGAGRRPPRPCARSWARRNPHRPKPRSGRRADHARSAFSPLRSRLQADRRAGTDRTKPGSGGSPPARDGRARS